MVMVKARPNENIDNLLRRFKKAVDNAGVLTSLRKKEYYEKPSQIRKRKKAAAIKRAKKNEATRKVKPSQARWQWNRDRTRKIYFTPKKPNTINKVKKHFNKHSTRGNK